MVPHERLVNKATETRMKNAKKSASMGTFKPILGAGGQRGVLGDGT